MLILENLSFDMNDEKGEVGIIKSISFTVDGDEFVIITGPSGGGKSITAKLIVGVERLTGGRILFGRQSITGMSTTDRANLGISSAFQQPVRFKGMQVVDPLRLTAKRKLTVSEACQCLTGMGLCVKDYVNRKVDASLSGGELKGIKIATVTTGASKLFIFGGPETGIDLQSSRNLTQISECTRQNTGGSILIISHQERIPNIADEIAVIIDGRVANQGAKDEIAPQIIGTVSTVGAHSKFYETA